MKSNMQCEVLVFQLVQRRLAGKKTWAIKKKQIEWHMECASTFLHLVGPEESCLDTRSIIHPRPPLSDKSFLQSIT